jgi:hypothetical protein
MSDARPFASLSSGLLARKGAAKPAMRPQAFGQIGASLDDLGWDDMGDPACQPAPEPEHVPSSIAALTPSPRLAESVEEPPVRDQQRVIAERFEVEAEAEAPREIAVPVAAPPPVVVSMPKRSPVLARDKTAFTLRLDAERHFRLRLACAVTGRSAQQIVTEALDDFLQTIPELDAMAGQFPAHAARRS